MVPKTPTTTTQVSKVELPPWVDQAAQSNYKLAQDVAGRPYKPYTGLEVAGQDSLEKWADKYFADTTKVGQAENKLANSSFGKANNAITQAGGEWAAANDSYGAANNLIASTAGGLPAMDRGVYSNPFNTEVLDRSLADLDRQRQIAVRENSDAAQRSGSFGGSRHGVTEAVIDSEYGKNAGDLSAQLRSEGYDKATSAMQADLDRRLAGAQGYQQSGAGYTGVGQGFLGQGQGFQQTGEGYLASSKNASDLRNRNLVSAMTLGQSRRSIHQEKLDAAKAKWQGVQNAPLEKLNVLLSALGMSPYGKTENTTKTENKGSGGSDFATIGAGVLSMLPALFALSDRTEKTDIRKVGKEKLTGLPLYSYRYKGDPKTYPKVVGPMAQDVAKKYPGAVAKVGGKLVIRTSAATSTFGHPDEGMTNQNLPNPDRMDRTPDQIMIRRRVGRGMMGA